MGITNESVFEYYYFAVDAHFSVYIEKSPLFLKKKKNRELVAIRTSYPISLIIFPRPMISKSTHVRRAEQQRMFCCCWFWALLCFLLQMLYDDEPGVEDVSCGLSLKKTWFNGCFSHLSLQFCMLSGVLKSISSWQLVKSQRPPQKASSTHPLWLSSRRRRKRRTSFLVKKKSLPAALLKFNIVLPI